jgi:Flp pilus assembly protein TadD
MPNDDVAHNELGEIYSRLGRKAEAIAEFQAALQINPNFSRARKNLDAVRQPAQATESFAPANGN